jgi:hypothetical protein
MRKGVIGNRKSQDAKVVNVHAYAVITDVIVQPMTSSVNNIATRGIRRVTLLEHEMLTISSLGATEFIPIRVAPQSLTFYVVFCRPLFVFLYFKSDMRAVFPNQFL